MTVNSVDPTDWFPTRGGSYSAYMPQYLSGQTWIDVPFDHVPSDRGVPYPADTGNITEHVGLCGYAQAMAMAWTYAAFAEAETGERIKVRVQRYQVKYDIKARAVDDDLTTSERKP